MSNMSTAMAVRTKSDQIAFGIIPQLAPRYDVVDLQIVP
jgi:hypothetical protein